MLMDAASMRQQARIVRQSGVRDGGTTIGGQTSRICYLRRDAGHALADLVPLVDRAVPHLIGNHGLPPGKGGKGPAALALMVHLRWAGLFFIGDDETDEDVFELT